MARLVGKALSDQLGQPVVIDNKPGASGNIAVAEVARAPADGHTFLVAPTTVETANPRCSNFPCCRPGTCCRWPAWAKPRCTW
jgi:tripartite-type tricarboxylate transporter receptor subunit TctC